MNGELAQVTLSILSIVVASASAILTFYMYWTGKINLQKYDLELDHLKKQMRYNAFFEIRKSLDDLNNRMVDWNVDLPILGGKIQFNHVDERKKAIIFMNRINILFYSLLQKDSLGEKYLEFLKKWTESSIYNVAIKDEVTQKMMDIIVLSEPTEPAEIELVGILKNIQERLVKEKSKLN